MKVITLSKQSRLAIAVNKIDFINWEEATGGKALMKIGTGGYIHHAEFDSHEQAQESYNTIIDLISEL